MYGHMSGIAKLASKVCSPGTPLKFDESTRELTSLAKQVRGSAAGGRPSFRPSCCCCCCCRRRHRRRRCRFATPCKPDRLKVGTCWRLL